ncbi:MULTISPECIES: VWA domain-containing protein [unclassified Pseudodesulfovibrio]|uniref:vWA domain-containing protein n=1 Tax=unclassified Pseudodesulfovibrio TaxID=2661612 RepID=UPI000FEB7F56|nr:MULTISPECIES: VWA domain-containing protein [unclassified Pseudodesulfovibrio]RWU04625.1 VWA domain-containing protein [Pseudodesulfovibrio sp. S3]
MNHSRLSHRPPCRCHKSRKGTASILIVVLLPVLLGFVGIAIDMGNIYMTHTKLQASVDAGALAGSLELPYDPDLSKGIVKKAVEDMVAANMESAVVISVVAGTEIRSVKVMAQAEVKMLLMEVLGIADSVVEAHASAGFNKLEVVFVVDNSGSMKGTPIDMVKQASIELTELLIPDGATPDTKVGMVAFRGKVRIGEGVEGFEPGCHNADGSLNTGIHEDFMDDYWALSDYYRRYITLDTCSDLPEALPLSQDKDLIISSINTQTATGASSGTVIPEGIKWGRHILTSEAPYTQGGDKEDFRKIMIVLTDGDTEDGECGGPYRAYYRPNNYWTNAYFGMGVDTAHCEDGGVLNTDMLSEAQAAKDAGIEIFTIRFGTSDNTDIALMKQIASSKAGTDDHYFNAPSVYDIPDIFKQIGKQLGWRLL